MTDRLADRPKVGGGLASKLNVLAGIWLMVSPWVLGYSWPPVVIFESVVVGIAVLFLAVIRLSRPHSTVLSWINILLGTWLFISPFLLDFYELPAATANAMLPGFFIANFGLLAAYANHTTPPRPR